MSASSRYKPLKGFQRTTKKDSWLDKDVRDITSASFQKFIRPKSQSSEKIEASLYQNAQMVEKKKSDEQVGTNISSRYSGEASNPFSTRQLSSSDVPAHYIQSDQMNADVQSVFLSQLPYLLARRFFLILSCVAIVSFLTIAYLATVDRDYQSSARLLLDPGQFQVAENSTSTQLGESTQSARVASEVFIILSNRVLRQVVIDLDLVNDAVFRTGSSLARSVLSDGTATSQSEFDIIETTASLREHVDAAQLDSSLIFEITAKHPDPNRARDIANTISSVFLRLRNQDRREAEETTAAQLAKRAEDLLQNVTATQEAVEAWKVEKNIVSTGNSGLITDQRVEQLNRQIVEARVELSREEARLKQVRELKPSRIASGALPEVLTSTAVGDLRAQYSRLLEREAALNVTLGPLHPQLQVLATRKANTELQITQAIDRLRNSIEQNYQRVRSQVQALEAEAGRLQADSQFTGGALIELRRREQEAAIALEVYQDFQNSAQTLREQASIDLSKVQVVSPAQTPLVPLGPPWILALAAAFLFGTILGAALGLLIELARGTLLTHQQVRAAASLPIVLSVPSINYHGASWLVFLLQKLGIARKKDVNVEQQFAFQALGNRLIELKANGSEEVSYTGKSASVCFVSTPGSSLQKLPADFVQTLSHQGVNLIFARYSSHNNSYGDDHSMPNLGSSQIVQPLNRDKKTDLKSVLLEDAKAGKCQLIMNAASDVDPDLIVIDASHGLSQDNLPDLIQMSDRTIILTQIGTSTTHQLNTVSQALIPWRSKIAGVLSLGQPV